MELSFTEGRHAPRVAEVFGDRLDAFLREDVLRGLHGREWVSALCVEGGRAMLHTFVPRPIPGTSWCDIEPFYGYAGPVFEGWDREFAQAALAAYRAGCRERRIVAELIRFQPERENHLPLVGLDGISLHPGRPIAYVPIVDGDEDEQLAAYSAPCRRQIRAGRGRLEFRRMSSSARDWAQFRALYRESLGRNGAARRWYFDDAFFERMPRSESVSLWGVFDPRSGELLSGTIVVAARGIVHTLFVANAPPGRLRGACDLLMHGVVRAFREEGCRWVCLGGGRSSADDDALLAFKKKFGPQHARRIPLGVIVHDPAAVEALCALSRAEDRSGAAALPSNELVTRFMPYRLSPSFAPHDSFPLDGPARPSAERAA